MKTDIIRLAKCQLIGLRERDWGPTTATMGSRRKVLMSARPGKAADVDNIAGDVLEAVEPVAIRR